MLGLDSLRNDGNEERSKLLIDNGVAPPRAEYGAVIKREGEKNQASLQSDWWTPLDAGTGTCQEHSVDETSMR